MAVSERVEVKLFVGRSPSPYPSDSGLRPMPKVSEFYGVAIYMYFSEHGPPHFHAEYGGGKAAISFDGRVQRGKLPPRALRLVREWSRVRRSELVRNWALARKGLELVQIPPLE